MAQSSSGGEMPFLDHLEELRHRILKSLGALVVGVIVAFTLITKFQVVEFLARPVLPYLSGGQLVYTSPADAFKIVMGLAFALGLIFALPVTVIILVPFLRAIPKELEEAAAIDGASRLAFFFRMVVPLSVPGVVTVGILAFIASWNSYLLPLFILNNEASYTLPLGVQAFASQYSVDTARVLAFTSLSMIPALIFFSFFQKRIVGGLTGAIKG